MSVAALVVIGFKQMTIAIHRNLQTAMAGEGLYRLGLQVCIDPA